VQDRSTPPPPESTSNRKLSPCAGTEKGNVGHGSAVELRRPRGGAGSGIGHAIAIGLAEAGADVACLGHVSKSGPDETAARIVAAARWTRDNDGVMKIVQDTDSVKLSALRSGAGRRCDRFAWKPTFACNSTTNGCDVPER